MMNNNFEFKDFFHLALKRKFPDIIRPVGNNILNFGCGNSPIKDAINYDIDDHGGKAFVLDMNRYPYAIGSDSADCIHCYHALEHVDYPLKTLQEFGRIIKPNAPINIVVPYWKSQMAYSSLDHRSFWSEETIRKHFCNDYYNSVINSYGIKENFSLICGFEERAIVVFIQLYKKGSK